MNPMLRRGGFGLLCLLAILAGWRVYGQMQAERLAGEHPEHALEWRPNDPQALLALAQRHLRDGDVTGATALARRLLAHEPLQAEAYRILAQAAERQGDPARALKLYAIAARRAPRDLAVQAWLTQYFLQQGNNRQALSHIDHVLRMSPVTGRRVYPLLGQLARDDAFAQALAAQLASNPPWRSSLLASLLEPRSGDPVAAGRVLQALKARAQLTPEDEVRWLDSLLAQGRWGEAFARWAGTVSLPGGRLPLVYNGGFERVPSGAGFDWRNQKVAGVVVRFEQLAGTDGLAAYLRFLDRRVGEAGLRHPLALAPGRYRLTLRLRAQGLRSALGMEWRIVCAGPGGMAARGEAVDGSFDWKIQALDVSVPATGCPGQWLKLVNPVPAGAGQRVSGDLWIDDVVISPEAGAS